MHGWSAERIAAAAGAELVRSGAGHPVRIDIDSRQAGPGGLFVGLKGVNSDGGAFATQALERGAWGALVGRGNEVAGDGAVLVADNPLLALQHLATAYRRELGATVIGVTGSTGKTSTKDILEALLSPQVGTWATTGNLNTEIGVPMTILAAVPGTAMVVLEMAMRGAGQIAELGAIAEPDVGVIVNVGPVHLELLGSIEAIAATKAELIAALPPSGTAVIPADEPLLESHLRDDIEIVRFGEEPLPDALTLTIAGREPSAHMLANARAAVAAARAAGVEPTGRIDVEL
ncbi:MAG TPA: UDP-N-acetylmuramoyl-tripeptide--D-alanyl-D-alanine ligase, partial [Baekduia sp.]|nr:UDP-N-acetylmuramoyl-tripeptide--D-alanyl-D-alanine ligase [Baekduia sp.]